MPAPECLREFFGPVTGLTLYGFALADVDELAGIVPLPGKFDKLIEFFGRNRGVRRFWEKVIRGGVLGQRCKLFDPHDVQLRAIHPVTGPWLHLRSSQRVRSDGRRCHGDIPRGAARCFATEIQSEILIRCQRELYGTWNTPIPCSARSDARVRRARL